jgi:holo-[acyl-carrier protein] synthase
MDIVGLGLDVIEIARIAALLERYGDRFRQRVYTPGEIAYCEARRSAAASYAARFAAKEAAMKALGTGRAHRVLWRSIEVVRHMGPPQLKLHGAAERHAARLGATRAFLTLTHARDLAIAQVILTTG